MAWPGHQDHLAKGEGEGGGHFSALGEGDVTESREVAVGTLWELTGSRKPMEPGSSTEHRTEPAG